MSGSAVPERDRRKLPPFILWLLPALILAAAAAAILLPGQRASVSGRDSVNIYVDGSLYESFPTGEEHIVTIERNGESNVILLEKDGVRMLSSTCRNQICVNTGKLYYADAEALDLNSWIVCLPNKVSVEVLPGGF